MTTDVLVEATRPHFATDEGQKFLKGQATQDEIRSLLSQHNSPEASQHFNQLLLNFMWEEISPSTLQAELQHLFTSNPSLQASDLLTDFSPVLTASANTDAEQASVKKAFCDLLGLVTQKRDASRPTLEDGIRFQQDVEERFKSQPGKYKRFQRVGFGPWREGRPAGEVRAQMGELLEGEGDLLEQFEAIWPEKRAGEGRDGVVA